MQSYLGDSGLKHAWVTEIRKHEDADMLVKGSYGTDATPWRGCAIGCALRSLNIIQGKRPEEQPSAHHRFPQELGIPETLAHLEDYLFESLPIDNAKLWPRRFAEAIPVGVDLSRVAPRLVVWILDDRSWGVAHATDDPRGQRAIHDTAALVRRVCRGHAVIEAEWNAAVAQARAIRGAATTGAVGRWAAETGARAAQAGWWATTERTRTMAWAGATWVAKGGAEVWAEAEAEAGYHLALSKQLLALLAATEDGNDEEAS